MIRQKYEPIFDIPENMLYGIGDRKLNEEIKLTIDYQIIEKTKNYIVLRINSSFLALSARKF